MLSKAKTFIIMSYAKAALGISRFSLDSKHPNYDHLLRDPDRLDDDDVEPNEKDDVEIELEQLVFGNRSGFQQGLISHQDNTNFQIFQDFKKTEQDDHITEEQNEAIHDVEDADVGPRLPLKQYQTMMADPISCFSSIPIHLL